MLYLETQLQLIIIKVGWYSVYEADSS